MKSVLFYPFLLLSILIAPSFIEKAKIADENPAYVLFTKEGKAVSYDKMIKELKDSDIILFGEYHNNPISHWLELSVLKALDKSKAIVGAEMFVSNEQSLLNSYLNKSLSEDEFKKQVQLWNNYNTDYKPLVAYAANNQILFIATNCDRKFARLVAKNGISSLDTLKEIDKKFLAPLPIEIDLNLPGYKKFIEGDFHGHGGNGKYMAEAQALKDATMAHFIYSNWTTGKTFVHFNGTYHSDNYEGIYWYLKKLNNQLKVKTIATIEQSQLKSLDKENRSKADFIIVIPEDMTKTY